MENTISVSEKEKFEKYRIMQDDLLRPVQKIGFWGKAWIIFLVVICLCGVYAYFLQETKSKYETISLRDYTMWGVYISTFVFYVALSLAGSLMSAVLKLIKFEWHRPLARIAEVIALGSIVLAGVCIVAAMGQPLRLHYLFLHGRIQSPIVWDVIVIITYTFTSFLFLFIPLIPGIKMCKDRLVNKPKWQMWMYRKLSFGWTGSPEQWKILKKSVRILAILVIPLGVSIHTVTAWLFATTLRAEWDSTNFGPYFVAGAFLLGIAGVIVAAFVIRKVYKLEKYIKDMHFDKMGQLLVFLSMIYIYFNVNEYLVPAYKMSSLHRHHLMDMFSGDSAPLYWMVVLFGMFIPAILPLFRKMRKPVPLMIIAAIVVIAAWFKRYLIVIPGLSHPYLPIQDVPPSWQHYTPSLVEMTFIAATFAALLLFITIFSRLFPILSIWEIAEGDGVSLEKLHDNIDKK